MREILNTTDMFKATLVQQMLEGHGISCALLDAHIGSIYGGIGGMAARLMVSDEDYSRAIQLIKEAEES